MSRVIFNLASAGSLLLFVGTIIFWAWSFHRRDEFGVQKSVAYPNPTTRHVLTHDVDYMLGCTRGTIYWYTEGEIKDYDDAGIELEMWRDIGRGFGRRLHHYLPQPPQAYFPWIRRGGPCWGFTPARRAIT